MKKKPKKAEKQAVGGRPMRVRHVLAERLDMLAERNATTATEEMNRAVREYLEREKLWPPEQRAQGRLFEDE